jgi:hypothetical protein
VKDLAGMDQRTDELARMIESTGITAPGESIILTGEMESGAASLSSFVRVIHGTDPVRRPE